MKPDLIDKANEEGDCVEIALAAGVTLNVRGATWRGVCPLSDCGTSSKSEPFVVYNGKSRWICHSCDDRGGDAVDLEHRLFSRNGETMGDAARRILGHVGREESEESRARRAQARAVAEADEGAAEAWKARLAVHLWREAVPAAGTLAQTYFEHRAIRGPVLARGLEVLRFNPRAYYSGPPEWDLFPPKHGVFLPAVIGLVMTELGPTGGVLCVYLRPNGKGKTHRDPAKKMWGPQGHVLLARQGDRVGPPDRNDRKDLAEVRLPGGVWLSRPDSPGPLAVAEGYENAFSRAMMLAGELCLPVRAVAAGSLNRLQGGELKDADGAVDVWTPTGDPMRPPFTWPEDPASPWGIVDIACDADMSPLKVKGRNGRGRIVRFTRDAKGRAKVCGALAVQGWRRRLTLGGETVVKASRPPPGLDFNDIRRAAEAAETAIEAETSGAAA
ncbi:hypothetical protein KOAAANKH_00112 [Brevundimonas sp. NIBR10]|nr:hypothetical protein KOAAANKH_00112 [Brevundimonas sp. NIBR10]